MVVVVSCIVLGVVLPIGFVRKCFQSYESVSVSSVSFSSGDQPITVVRRRSTVRVLQAIFNSSCFESGAEAPTRL